MRPSQPGIGTPGAPEEAGADFGPEAVAPGEGNARPHLAVADLYGPVPGRPDAWLAGVRAELARVPGRRTTYRTERTGWYVRQNRSLAIGADGGFYVLDVPASVKSRMFGATVVPSDPPLVVGRGARDGESIDLAELLRRALPQD